MKCSGLLLRTMALLTAVASTVQSQPLTGGTKDLYKGIEFKMEPVKEPVIPANTVSITDFGAVSGGGQLATAAFDAAINALARKGGGRVVIPRGLWFTGPITLKSNIELFTEAGALVLFSPDKSLYPLVETNFEGYNTFRCTSPINGRNLTNIAITGRGVFDGSGDVWRSVKKEKLTESQWKKLVASGGLLSENGKTWYPSEQFRKGEKMAEMNVPRTLKTKEEFEQIRDFLRPVMVSLVHCKQVLIDGPCFQNSPAWCIHPLLCEELTVRNTTVKNPWYSQNGDGIDIESCRNTLLHDCNFDVGDDAICIKSGKDKEGRDRGKPTENLIVKNCIVYHGHGGVTIGSEMSGGVKNMHVSNCTFIGTDVGLRFKSNRGRGGVVSDIFMSDVDMINIPAQAISFDLFYGGKAPSEVMEEGGAPAPEPAILPVTDETPQFRQITLRNIRCKGGYQAIFLQGLPEMNLHGFTLENIRMETENGFKCVDAEGIHIRNLSLVLTKSPALELKNCKNFTLDGLTVTGDKSPVIRVDGAATGQVTLKGTGLTDPSKQLVIEKEVPTGVVQLSR